MVTALMTCYTNLIVIITLEALQLFIEWMFSTDCLHLSPRLHGHMSKSLPPEMFTTLKRLLEQRKQRRT